MGLLPWCFGDELCDRRERTESDLSVLVDEMRSKRFELTDEKPKEINPQRWFKIANKEGLRLREQVNKTVAGHETNCW